MTHPFHPSLGETLVVEEVRHLCYGDRLFCRDGSGRPVVMPPEWTSWAVPDPFVAMSNGRADFRVTDLLELSKLLKALLVTRDA